MSKSKKDTPYNGQTIMDKSANNDLQNITHKTKDRVTWTPLKTGAELRCPGRVGSSKNSCSASYKPSDKSWMWKGPESVYNKWNIYVVICDRCSVTVNQVMVATVKLSKWWLQRQSLYFKGHNFRSSLQFCSQTFYKVIVFWVQNY
jgi:hypothetical protein